VFPCFLWFIGPLNSAEVLLALKAYFWLQPSLYQPFFGAVIVCSSTGQRGSLSVSVLGVAGLLPNDLGM